MRRKKQDRNQKLKKSRGQATTEYVMLLAVLAGIILVLGFAFKSKIQNLLQNRVGSVIQNQFFNTDQLHRFRLGIPR